MDRLFELRRDVSEGGVEVCTDQIDRRDDRDRNPGGNKAILDCGRARLVLQKRNDSLHVKPLSIAARPIF